MKGFSGTSDGDKAWFEMAPSELEEWGAVWSFPKLESSGS